MRGFPRYDWPGYPADEVTHVADGSGSPMACQSARSKSGRRRSGASPPRCRGLTWMRASVQRDHARDSATQKIRSRQTRRVADSLGIFFDSQDGEPDADSTCGRIAKSELVSMDVRMD
jgi:hypothetical protein